MLERLSTPGHLAVFIRITSQFKYRKVLNIPQQSVSNREVSYGIVGPGFGCVFLGVKVSKETHLQSSNSCTWLMRLVGT